MPSLTKLCFALFLSAPLILAQRSGFGEACDQSNNHLDANTWNLITDCDPQTYCADNGTCAYKGCRKDIYPFGYNGIPFAELPPMCPDGQFCPDEGDRCLDVSPIGGQCQKDRDDECAHADNYKELSGYLNVNGSICLNYTCQLADAALGQTCIFENTRYQAYTDAGTAYAFVVSRDNCRNGLYCDGSTSQCLKMRAHGAACDANKECLSYNCESDGKCGRAADEPIHPPTYSYALVGVGILILIVGVMATLWFFHRKSRKENQIRLEQYYNEQIAYRQSIMSMSHAKNSLLSLPANTASTPPRGNSKSMGSPQRPEVARQSLLGEEAFNGYTGAGFDQDALPPNMRRDSSAAWSEADSEVMLVDQKEGQEHGGPSKWGRK